MSTPSRPLTALLEGLPVGAYLCDRHGLITYFNPAAAKVWGRHPKLNDSADRYCGSHKLFWIDHEPMTHEQCWMARALREDRPYNGCDVVVQQPGGERIIVLAHANPLHDDDHQLNGGLNVLIPVEKKYQSGRGSVENKRRIVVTGAGRETTVLASLLTGIGHDVKAVSSGIEAVQMSKKFRPDVVFTELMLKPMDGYEVARTIRRAPWGHSMVLVAINQGTPADHEQARAAGFDHQISRHLNVADVLPILASIKDK
jgi:CheY-like chemotaxis protein